MAELNPWDEGYTLPSETESPELNPWDEGYVLPKAEVPMDTPTAEELQKYSEPDPARASLVTKPKELQDTGGFTEEEANTIPLGDMDVPQTIQFNRDQNAANQYENYQSGNVVQKVVPSEHTLERDRTEGETTKLAADIRPTKAFPDSFEVTTDMYQKSKNPQLLYETLKKAADGQDITGQKTYKGRIIPSPQNYSGAGFDGAGSITGLDLAADTTREVTKETLTTIAANVDEIAQSMGYNTNWTKTVQEGIANPAKAEAVSHALSKEVFRVGVSVATGMKTGSKIASATNQNSLNTWALSAASGMALEVLTRDSLADNLIVGDKSLVELNEGFNPEEGATDADKHLRRKGDQLLDTFLTAGPAAVGTEIGAKVLGAGAKVVGKIKNSILPNKEGIMKEEAEKLLYLAKDPDGTPIKTTKQIDDIKRYLDEHGEVTIYFGDGTANPVTIKRTSMSAINEGAEKEGNSLLATSALEMEKTAHKQNSLSTSFDNMKQQPIREFGKAVDQVTTARGGRTAIEETKDLLANQAIKGLDENTQRLTQAKSEADSIFRQTQKEAAESLRNKKIEGDMNLGAAEDLVSNSKKDLEVAEQGLQHLYKTDRTFTKTIDELSQETGIDIGGRNREEAVGKFLPKLVEGVRRIKQKKNDLYTLIPDDADIDEQSFLTALEGTLKANALPTDAQKMLSQELGDNMDNIETLSFGKIYKMLPKINKAIIDVSSSPAADREIKLEALRGLRDNINQVQMQHLIDTGNADVADAARNAVEYYKGTYVKFARQKNTPITTLFDSYDQAWNDYAGVGPRDKSGKLTEIQGLGNNFSTEDTAKNVAEEGMKDKTSGSSKQIDQFLKSEDTPDDLEDSFLNIHRAEVADSISEIRRSGKEVTPESIAKVLQSKGVSLKNSYPEFTAGIENFIKRLDESQSGVSKAKESLKGSEEFLQATKKQVDDTLKTAKTESKDAIKGARDQMESTISSVEENAAKTKREIEDSAVGKYFLEKAPDGVKGKKVPVGSGYKAFKKLLSTPGNSNKLKYVAEQIRKSGDKNAQSGFENAAFEMLAEIKSASNDYKFKGEQAKKALSDWNREYGKIIFGNSDDPKEAAKKVETFESMLKLVDIVNKEQLKNVSTTSALGQEKDQTVAEAKRSVQYITNYFFDRISKTSSRITGTANRIIDNLNPEEKRKAITSKMYEDPQTYKEALDLIREAVNSPKSSELRRALVLTGVITGKNLSTENSEEIKNKIKIPEGVF